MVIRTGILCVPTHDDEAIDRVSQLLRSALPDAFVVETSAAQSQLNWIEELLRRWCDEEELDLLVTIGGTFPAIGPSSAEIVPEATQNVIERLLPGLSEAMRAYAQDETPLALLDRGIAGIRGRSLIINLPEGAAPAYLFLDGVVDLIAPIMACLDDDALSPSMASELILEDVNELPADSTSENIDRLADEPPEENPKGNIVNSDPPQKKKGLDAAEFAEYLANRGTSTTGD